jgi:hypothetical protein
MIWTFIARFSRWLLRALLRWLIPAPSEAAPVAPRLPVIDKNEPCPACGHRGGKLQCVVGHNVAFDHDKLARKESSALTVLDGVAVQITCDECGCKWFKQTVYEIVTGKCPEVTA